MTKKIKILETFGAYIRRLRVEKGIGQRELAEKISVAVSYLNDHDGFWQCMDTLRDKEILEKKLNEQNN